MPTFSHAQSVCSFYIASGNLIATSPGLVRESARRTLRPNDLFALGFVHDAQLSPDGCVVAYVTSRTIEQTQEELFEITLEELSSGRCRSLPFRGRATFPRWSPDGRRLAFVGSSGGDSRVYVAEASTASVSALTPADLRAQGAPSWSPDGETLACTIVNIVRSGHGFRRITRRIFRSEGLGEIDDLEMHIHLVNTRTGAMRWLDLGTKVATQPAFSPCGKRLLFMGSDAAVGYQAISSGLRLLTFDLADSHVTQVLGERWFIAAAAWSRCGERIVVVGALDSELTVPSMSVWVVNRDGSNPRCRTIGCDGDAGMRAHHDMPTWETSQRNLLCVPDAERAYATVMRRGNVEIWEVALDGEPRCKPVIAGPRSCLIMDVGPGNSQILFCASDLHTPWELYSFDPTTRTERRITRLNADTLAGWPTLTAEHLDFRSSDGTPLEGWHLMRADRHGPQPTVQFIHGGPFLTTGNIFRFDSHLLAANGFGVLFSNFRGSAGYGEAFSRAIMGDWGTRGFGDHMAAIDAGISRGLVDPQRCGVWGPSHGGFATCWIVGHTNRFRAAVAESAMTNFVSLYYLSDVTTWIVRDLGGTPDEIPDIYRSRSPLTYASRCRTPTLLVHGEDDVRCPISESEQFYRALHDAGCVTELVRIPGMSHMGDSTGPLGARLGQNEALLDWFERHL